MMLNRDSDPEDDSRISQIEAGKRDFVKKTLKMRDSDGKWVYKYNSVLQGKLTIETIDGERTLDPQSVIKDYNQQVPLGYYYIDTNQDVTIDTIDQAVIE